MEIGSRILLWHWWVLIPLWRVLLLWEVLGLRIGNLVAMEGSVVMSRRWRRIRYMRRMLPSIM